eukprot:TRINITY_DN27083_c0_g1_i1.p1 TRINITY_DN27083_c0_g1~~TRINITY_DN27083_c0_g1_i1.p1  ORF type:complete len:444 (+),score=88.08 TRINITY_DN27083_c0_g1_i1:81-1334(+)
MSTLPLISDDCRAAMPRPPRSRPPSPRPFFKSPEQSRRPSNASAFSATDGSDCEVIRTWPVRHDAVDGNCPNVIPAPPPSILLGRGGAFFCSKTATVVEPHKEKVFSEQVPVVEKGPLDFFDSDDDAYFKPMSEEEASKLPVWAAPTSRAKDEQRPLTRRTFLSATVPLRSLKPHRASAVHSSPMRPKRPEDPLTVTDLAGGNGRWRQRKAEAEFAKREIQEADDRRQESLKRERERLRQLEEEEKSRRIQLEMQQEIQAELARRRREEEEEAKLRFEEREKQRKKLEEEMLRRLKYARKPCQKCDSSGVCMLCKGDGYHFKLLLSPQIVSTSKYVATKNRTELYGSVPFGCKGCANASEYGKVSGDLWKGNGVCPTCRGVGSLPSDAAIADMATEAAKTLAGNRPSSRSPAILEEL